MHACMYICVYMVCMHLYMYACVYCVQVCIWMYMCCRYINVSVHCMYKCTYMYIWMCVETRGQRWVSSSTALCFLLGRGCLTGAHHFGYAGWSEKSRNLTILTFLVLEQPISTTRRSELLMLKWKALYQMSHLPIQ